ncbi:tripartite tricarboxylate transporter substrate-binding protein [Pseudacidovorax sp. RU35E]|uniref:tripartite tricarboxylate transporter substrate-binding protein n=1 Tax=Pseudacidovorax sp. RU35E TaxID=1907403 RepID=UPI0009541D71|nr:tripartite tricarboxylate transporter substrate-binding protein [Pseudacidovorax sp. RU35E]SIQ60591.1 Tripartite-type tricarboxylate transporter, receptor component TctC [Pseudacidovorax sp. RU35E]
MNHPTRRAALAGAAALLAPWAAIGQEARGTVRLIVPYPPGAATDALARLLAQALQADLGGSMIVENKGGAATQIGTKAIAQAKPDGQTLGFVDTSFVINPGLFGAALPYSTPQDFTAISLLATAPLVLVVHKSVEATDMKSFLALARSKPGVLGFGSAGVGSAPHLAGEQFKRVAQVDVRHIPYRGGSTVITDLIAGHVQFGFTTVPTMLDHIRAGTVRALAVTGGRRAAQLPEVPTMAELGLAGVDTKPLFGLIGPAGLPEDLVRRLGEATAQAVQRGDLGKRLEALGFEPVGSTPAAFAERIRTEIIKWTEVIKRADIKPAS